MVNHLITPAVTFAVMLGLAAAVGVAASASSVGSGPFPSNLGTGSAALVACDGTLTVSNWEAEPVQVGVVDVTAFTLTVTDSGTEPCVGQTAEVTVTDSANQSLSTFTLPHPLVSGPQQVVLPTALDSRAVTGIQLTVHD